MLVEVRLICVEMLDLYICVDVVMVWVFVLFYKLLGYVYLLLKNGVVGLFFKGCCYEEELIEVWKNWIFEFEVIFSCISDGVIFWIEEVKCV